MTKQDEVPHELCHCVTLVFSQSSTADGPSEHFKDFSYMPAQRSTLHRSLGLFWVTLQHFYRGWQHLFLCCVIFSTALEHITQSSSGFLHFSSYFLDPTLSFHILGSFSGYSIAKRCPEVKKMNSLFRAAPIVDFQNTSSSLNFYPDVFGR